MQDLINELQTRIKTLDVALKAFGKRGIERAEAEKAYRTALAKKILIERDNKVPVTIISDVCRGSAEIADLKLKRDIADTMYDSAKEAINVYKLNIKVIEGQIEREWHSG
jgi:hypothetical protein